MLSYDEETTCLGVVDTIRRLGHDLPLPVAAIVGEPTELEVVDAHKSVVTFFTRCTGFEAHSSKPYLGASAVMTAAELIAELNRIADDMMVRGDPSGRFDPPYTTVHVGTIEGGNARNIIAKSCSFHWEFRGLPESRPGGDSGPARTLWRARSRSKRLNRFGALRSDRDEAGGRRAGPCAGCRLGRGGLGAAHWPAGTRPRRCPSAPRPGTIRRRASRRSCAARAPSIRRTSRTSTSRLTQLEAGERVHAPPRGYCAAA